MRCSGILNAANLGVMMGPLGAAIRLWSGILKAVTLGVVMRAVFQE